MIIFDTLQLNNSEPSITNLLSLLDSLFVASILTATILSILLADLQSYLLVFFLGKNADWNTKLQNSFIYSNSIKHSTYCTDSFQELDDV